MDPDWVLGLFIAKTLLERSGASVSMANAVTPAKGARVTILWQRSDFEQGNSTRALFAPAERRIRVNEAV